MDTNIVVPPAVYEAASERARQLGLSVSEFTALALRGVLGAEPASDITARLDQIYADESSRLESELLVAQAAAVAREDW